MSFDTITNGTDFGITWSRAPAMKVSPKSAELAPDPHKVTKILFVENHYKTQLESMNNMKVNLPIVDWNLATELIEVDK